MDFGIKLPHSGPLANPDAIREVSREAEHLAFHSVWVHDHISYGRDWLGHRASGLTEQINPDYEPDFYESVTTLAYIAGMTSSIRLGTSILVLPLRNPLVLGRQLLTLQALSHNRLVLGVGTGDYPDEFQALNVPYTERGKITDEYLEVLGRIFRGGKVEYQGSYCQVDEALFYPRVTPPPVFVGGGVIARPEPEQDRLAPAVLRRVARWGEGWMPDWGSPTLVQEGTATIHRLAAQYGRADHAYSVAFATVLFLGDSDAEAVAMTARTIQAAEAKANVVAGFGTRSLRKYFAKSLIGSPETLRDKVRRYADAGVGLMVMNCLAPDLDSFVGMLKRFRAEVAPLD